MSILHLISQDSFIAVNQKLIDTFGLYEACIIGHFASVTNYNQMTIPDYDGWFYVTYEKLERKLKLTEDKAAQPIKNLEKSGIIEIKKKGVPCRRYFKFNQEKLLNYLIPSSPPKNGGQETGNSGDKKPKNPRASAGKSGGQAPRKTGRNKKTDNNIDNNISIFSRDEMREYFNKMGYKSDPDRCWNFYQKIGWQIGKSKIVDKAVVAEDWEAGFKEKNPDLYETKTTSPKASKEIEIIRKKLKDGMGADMIHYDKYFGGLPVEIIGDKYVMKCNEKIKNEANRKYFKILTDLNIQLEINN